MVGISLRLQFLLYIFHGVKSVSLSSVYIFFLKRFLFVHFCCGISPFSLNLMFLQCVL